MRNSQSISLHSYGILDEYDDTKTFEELYPSFDNNPSAQAYFNGSFNSGDIDDDLLLDDTVSIMSRDSVMRSIYSYIC